MYLSFVLHCTTVRRSSCIRYLSSKSVFIDERGQMSDKDKCGKRKIRGDKLNEVKLYERMKRGMS